MEILIEILIGLILIPLELIVYSIFESFTPFKKAYDKTIEEGKDNNFLMILNPDIKKIYLAGIIILALVLILVDAFSTYFYISNTTGQTGFIVTVSICQSVCLPLITLCISGSLKKIYFAENKILYKSLLWRKKIEIDQINCVIEHNKKIIIIYNTKNNTKNFKIPAYYSNYDKALANLKKIKFYKVY